MRKPDDGVSDSTVADKEDDVCSVNSDPLNSSSSEYSYTASPPSFEPVLHEDTHHPAPVSVWLPMSCRCLLGIPPSFHHVYVTSYP